MSGNKFVLREGFWWSADKSNRDLPKVKARKTAWRGQREFLTALNRIEQYHPDTQKFHAKGWSNCRCCEKKNGSVQFKLRALGVTWEWPNGFRHYVEDHNVRPSLAFQEWILAVSEALPGTVKADHE